jgi:Family of unknown function (DUF5681)
VADNDTRGGDNEVGYGKPPAHSKFVKGQSGNPKGRPKGSQNLSTILDKVSRERVRVTENGRMRYISKREATILQLVNKAVAGDLNAARVLLSWSMWLTNSEQTAAPSPVSHERDQLVMESLIERIRQSEDMLQENDAEPVATGPFGKED